MAKAKLYEVYDLVTGELLATGSERKCAMELGVGNSAIGEIARGKYKSSRFRVVDATPPGEEHPKPKRDPEIDGSMRAAANRWEEFCAPIRRQYGIPVYKAPKKEESK